MQRWRPFPLNHQEVVTNCRCCFALTSRGSGEDHECDPAIKAMLHSNIGTLHAARGRWDDAVISHHMDLDFAKEAVSVFLVLVRCVADVFYIAADVG